MSYQIKLSGLEFYARHGCYELERTVGNRFGVDLVITAVLDDAAVRSDDVSQMVNYLDVYGCVERQISLPQCTIERVALNIIEALKSEFSKIEHISCTVSKFAPPLGGKAERVSVTIEQ